MAFEATSGFEAVLKQARDQAFVLGERHHAVADVAGREHVELAAQTAGAAAVIADGHYRCEFKMAFGGFDVALQSSQQRGKAGSATDGDNSQGRRGPNGGRFAGQSITPLLQDLTARPIKQLWSQMFCACVRSGAKL